MTGTAPSRGGADEDAYGSDLVDQNDAPYRDSWRRIRRSGRTQRKRRLPGTAVPNAGRTVPKKKDCRWDESPSDSPHPFNSRANRPDYGSLNVELQEAPQTSARSRFGPGTLQFVSGLFFAAGMR